MKLGKDIKEVKDVKELKEGRVEYFNNKTARNS